MSMLPLPATCKPFSGSPLYNSSVRQSVSQSGRQAVESVRQSAYSFSELTEHRQLATFVLYTAIEFGYGELESPVLEDDFAL